RDVITVAAGQHIGQRRLAGAVRPHDRMDLAGRDDQVDAAQDLLAVDGGVEVLDLEHSVVPFNSCFRTASGRSERVRIRVMVRAADMPRPAGSASGVPTLPAPGEGSTSLTP